MSGRLNLTVYFNGGSIQVAFGGYEFTKAEGTDVVKLGGAVILTKYQYHVDFTLCICIYAFLLVSSVLLLP